MVQCLHNVWISTRNMNDTCLLDGSSSASICFRNFSRRSAFVSREECSLSPCYQLDAAKAALALFSRANELPQRSESVQLTKHLPRTQFRQERVRFHHLVHFFHVPSGVIAVCRQHNVIEVFMFSQRFGSSEFRTMFSLVQFSRQVPIKLNWTLFKSSCAIF